MGILSPSDLTLIDLVDRAIDTGVGRSFESPGGQTVKVLALDEKWVALEAPMGNPETLYLPKNIRKIAFKEAAMRAAQC